MGEGYLDAARYTSSNGGGGGGAAGRLRLNTIVGLSTEGTLSPAPTTAGCTSGEPPSL